MTSPRHPYIRHGGRLGLALLACASLLGCAPATTAGGSGAEGDTLSADLAGADTSPAPDTSLADVGPVAFALCPDDEPDMVRPDGWAVASHCSGQAPDYDRLFGDDVVHEMTLTIDPSDWAAAQADLASLLGGSSGPGGPGGGPGGGVDLEQDPMWFPTHVTFDGVAWTRVGMRFKGNSSLRSAYQQGKGKLSFRFSFDKFEDDYPQIDNQRFYGFKKMTFSNGFKDNSLIRDKLAADLFRAGGVPAARGAFAAVTVDFGDGPVYFGLYTMIEDPSDELLGVQFDDDSGNLYKPDGAGAAWVSFVQDDFEKKTREDDADWSDIEAAFAALHASRTDAVAWRSGLEAVFDVEAFLRWLSLNQAMVNWDSYGRMTHNYYVYGDPSDAGRLVWFPWDLNEAMLLGGPQSQTATSVMCDGIGDQWPLIRYLLDDATYRARYEALLEEALVGPLAAATSDPLISAYHDLIAPWVVGPKGVETGSYTFLQSTASFQGSVSQLETFLAGRRTAVSAALGL